MTVHAVASMSFGSGSAAAAIVSVSLKPSFLTNCTAEMSRGMDVDGGTSAADVLCNARPYIAGQPVGQEVSLRICATPATRFGIILSAVCPAAVFLLRADIAGN